MEGIFVDFKNGLATILEGFRESGFPRELRPEALDVIKYLNTHLTTHTLNLDFEYSEEDDKFKEGADVVKLLRNAGFAVSKGGMDGLTIYTTRLHSLDAAQFFLTFSGLDCIAEAF